MADEQLCLHWNNHQSTLISIFDTLLENGTLVDCTLAAEGQYLKAHKVILSACSPYLETLFCQHYEKHPIVILKDVKFSELKSMMDYMYRGEVNISQDQLGTFLKAAESLQIKGLSDNGAEGDARDVGSTPKAPPPQRKATQPLPSSRPAEPQRPDVAPESPAHRSRDGSISPSSRKRRRIRRNSQEDDLNLGDSHLDTSNSCDLPSQAQSTPIVPNIPATVISSVTTTPIVKMPIAKPEQTESIKKIDTNSLPPESGLLKEKIEAVGEPLLEEPKTEYLDDVNNDDSIEDLTLDDDDIEGIDISNMSYVSNMSRPGPSHDSDVSLSNQGFAPWNLGGNQTGTDEVFMAAQEAVGVHRDSQDIQVKGHDVRETTSTSSGAFISTTTKSSTINTIPASKKLCSTSKNCDNKSSGMYEDHVVKQEENSCHDYVNKTSQGFVEQPRSNKSFSPSYIAKRKKSILKNISTSRAKYNSRSKSKLPKSSTPQTAIVRFPSTDFSSPQPHMYIPLTSPSETFINKSGINEENKSPYQYFVNKTFPQPKTYPPSLSYVKKQKESLFENIPNSQVKNYLRNKLRSPKSSMSQTAVVSFPSTGFISPHENMYMPLPSPSGTLIDKGGNSKENGSSYQDFVNKTFPQPAGNELLKNVKSHFCEYCSEEFETYDEFNQHNTMFHCNMLYF